MIQYKSAAHMAQAQKATEARWFYRFARKVAKGDNALFAKLVAEHAAKARAPAQAAAAATAGSKAAKGLAGGATVAAVFSTAGPIVVGLGVVAVGVYLVDRYWSE